MKVAKMVEGRGWLEFERDEEVEEYLRTVYRNILWYSSAYPRIDGKYKYWAVAQIALYAIINAIVCVIMGISFLNSLHLLLFAMKFLRMFCYSLMTQVGIFSLFTRRDSATFIYRAKTKNFFTYEDEEEEEKGPTKYETLIWILPAYLVVMVSNVIVVPFLEKYYGGEQLPDEIFDNHLIFPMWSPDPSSLVMRIILTIIFISFTLVVLSVTSGGVFLFWHLTESLLEQVRILNASIENLEERAKKHFLKTKKENHDWTYSDSINHCLNENIKHYIVLLRFNKEFERYVSPSLLIIFVLSAVFMACAAILLIKNGGNPFRLYTGVSSVMIEIYLVWFFNSYGQILIDECSNLRKRIYELKWYNFNKNNKRTINMMQTMTLTPLIIKAGGISDLDNATFQKVMNSAYSFINLFLAAK